jgi:hypothetical protein
LESVLRKGKTFVSFWERGSGGETSRGGERQIRLRKQVYVVVTCFIFVYRNREEELSWEEEQEQQLQWLKFQ